MDTRLIWITPEAEKNILYCARVSSPENQQSTNVGLLNYCLKHGHWSPFEMANACIEIKTSRAISAQILRHRSFSFQEFSQRYSKATTYEVYEARSQDNKNRQNSIDDLSEDTKMWFEDAQRMNGEACFELYQEALDRGVAKEQARMLLPINTSTTLYMNGSIRSWIHYINLRAEAGTQKEHRDIAVAIRNIFIQELPNISDALEWNKDGILL